MFKDFLKRIDEFRVFSDHKSLMTLNNILHAAVDRGDLYDFSIQIHTLDPRLTKIRQMKNNPKTERFKPHVNIVLYSSSKKKISITKPIIMREQHA